MDGLTPEPTTAHPLHHGTTAVQACGPECCPGESIAVMGLRPGKSTFLNLLGPPGRRAVLAGAGSSATSRDQLATIRNHQLGFVFRRSTCSRASALANVMLPSSPPDRPAGRRAGATRAHRGRTAERVDHRPNQPRGEQRRVAIARASSPRPGSSWRTGPRQPGHCASVSHGDPPGAQRRGCRHRRHPRGTLPPTAATGSPSRWPWLATSSRRRPARERRAPDTGDVEGRRGYRIRSPSSSFRHRPWHQPRSPPGTRPTPRASVRLGGSLPAAALGADGLQHRRSSPRYWLPPSPRSPRTSSRPNGPTLGPTRCRYYIPPGTARRTPSTRHDYRGRQCLAAARGRGQPHRSRSPRP
jgi:hypothetical protein